MPIPSGYREPLQTPRTARTVEAVWTFAAAEAGATKVLPDGRCDVILRFNTQRRDAPVPVVTGPATLPYVVTYDVGDTWVGLRLRPSFGGTIWGIRLAGMVNQVARGADAIEALPVLKDIVSASQTAPSLQAALLDVAAGIEAPEVSSGLSRAVDALHTSGGRMSIGDLAQLAGCTTRQLGRQFSGSIGVSPKTYAQLVRAHRALALIAGSPLSLTQIALEAGFADHAHMSRDLRVFCGHSPKDIPPTLTQPGFFG